MDFQLFKIFGGSLQGILDIFILKTLENVFAALTPFALAALTLYVVTYGYMVMTGRIPDMMMDAIGKIIKISLIVSIGLTAGNHAAVVIDGASALESGLLSVLHPVGSDSVPPGDAYEMLDKMAGKGFEKGVILTKIAALSGFLKGFQPA
ncbi:MAG: type IV secretion system protein [Proteobacteria bacterium]|nr:type IV secretion system protein [Pseudomonadota bacterium]